MNKEPFEIAYACCLFDFFTNRDVQLMELYRIVVSLVNSFKAHIESKNIPYLQHEAFPLDPPDVVRAKLVRVLHKTNQSLSDPLLN